MTVYIGDQHRVWAVFRDETGAQAAPTDVTLTVRKPDGTSAIVTSTPAVTDDETAAEAATGETLSGVTGVYRADISVDQAGRWDLRWYGSGAVTKAGQGWFDVPIRRVPAVSP